MVHHAHTLIIPLSKRHEELTKYLGKRDPPSLPNLTTLPRQPVPPSPQVLKRLLHQDARLRYLSSPCKRIHLPGKSSQLSSLCNIRT